MKQCPECGEVYNDTWKICIKDQVSLVKEKAPLRKVVQHAEAEPDALKGVGGWLGIFVWTLLIAGIPGALLVIYTLLTNKIAGIYPAGLPFSYNIAYTLLTILEVIAAILLFRKKASSLYFVRGVMMGWILLRAISVALVYQRNSSEIAGAVVGLFFEVIWFMYFMMSRRVKNTYLPVEAVNKPKAKDLYDVLRQM